MAEKWNGTTSYTEGKIFEGNNKRCMWLSVQKKKGVTACDLQHLFLGRQRMTLHGVKVLQPHCGSCRGQVTGSLTA